MAQLKRGRGFDGPSEKNFKLKREDSTCEARVLGALEKWKSLREKCYLVGDEIEYSTKDGKITSIVQDVPVCVAKNPKDSPTCFYKNIPPNCIGQSHQDAGIIRTEGEKAPAPPLEEAPSG